MIKIFKSNRCKICKSRRGYRFCIKIGENICWQDCNMTRIKLKCPQECDFTLKDTKNFQIKAKANSIAEYQDLLKKQIDKWINESQEFLDNNTPKKVAETEEGKERIITILNQFQIDKTIPLNHLKRILKLDKLKVNDEIINYEDVSNKYLENIVIQEWEKVVSFQVYPTHNNIKYIDDYIKLLENNKLIQILKEFELISSAFTKDKKQALVHFEINDKYDLTLKLVDIEGDWKVLEKVFGMPELVNGESDAIQQVAIMLSKNELSNAYVLLKKYSHIYCDSADFQYYWGMYYSFSKNVKNSKKFFFNAVLLDPSFTEAKYNYAYILHTENKIEEAKIIYNEILEISPNEPKTLNNLATIYIDEGNKMEAKKLLERCLKQAPDYELAKKNLEKLDK